MFTPKRTGYDPGMDVYIVGAGKLAGELLEQAPKFGELHVRRWGTGGSGRGRSLVVHAGSGRELPDVWAFCTETGSTLLELATGSTFSSVPSFPVVICANTNILMGLLRRLPRPDDVEQVSTVLTLEQRAQLCAEHLVEVV